MLTFDFTGVSGEMTVRDRLTSGMVGRQVTINLSEDWSGLTSTAVFIAGDICRAVELTDSILTIPADVLRHPYRKLLVGVCGTNGDGSLVIPTILVPGPFVECGADPTADQVTVDIPVWMKLQNQIGSLDNLTTAAKDNLVAAINELAARESGSGGSGADGFSIYYVNFTVPASESSAISVKSYLVQTHGRSVRVGDFLLSSNCCLAKVHYVTASDIHASFILDLKGTTPVRGTDYWTEDDIQQIKAYVDEAILGGAW